MISFDEFIKKYAGKKVDFDGYYGAQCMDLYRQYVQEVLGLPQSPAVPSAADLWNTIDLTKYDRITNTPNGIPVKGAIMVWKKTATLPYGHVSIYYSGDVMKFISFDQNWPIGSASHYQNHDYNGVQGWFVKKNVNNTTTDDEKMNRIFALKDQPGTNTEKLKKTEQIIHG